MSTRQDQAVIAKCSFCRKRNTDVDQLVAGPGVFICNECVVLAGSIITNAEGQPHSGLAPWELATNLDEVLASLGLVAEAGAQAEENLRSWVSRARSLGATWNQVGSALGMARQSAWERFSGEE